MTVEPLQIDVLRRDLSSFLPAFETTKDIPESKGVVGQERALAAIEFGAGMDHFAYNMFVMGPPGSGRHSVTQRLLQEKAVGESTPRDWVYVHNFRDAHKPNAIELPMGQGADLKAAMEGLIEELRSSIPAVFESEEYRTRRNAIQSEFDQKHENQFEALRGKAVEKNIVMMQTPHGFAFAPVRDGEVMRPEVFQQLSDEERQEIQKATEALQEELRAIMQNLPQWEKTRRDAIRALNREVAMYSIGHAVEGVRKAFGTLPECADYLEAVQADLLENIQLFMVPEEAAGAMSPVAGGATAPNGDNFRRYAVNVIVDHSNGPGAPVITEDSPTVPRLIGRSEHVAVFGALMTDFMLIKPGALHQANGGYLIIDAVRVLTQPFAWDTLKRALRSREIRIEAPAESLGFVSTMSLEPEPIPLQVRVVLVGERQHYYLLSQLDPDFANLFKVAVDFSEDAELTRESAQQYVSMIGSVIRQHNLKPMAQAGVGLLLNTSARIAEDAERITLLTGRVADLIREADYWATRNDHPVIEAADLKQAIAAQEHRADRLRDRAFESITRDIMLIDTDGEKAGQVNGLSVLDLGNFRFGKPTRITARIGLGAGKVLDIEREVELGGPFHSKGVLILSGYLNAMFGSEIPLSLSASLVFEQSYSGVDGDSASSAELYALISAISGVPLRQSLAVTGSVNQNGIVQAIGGVNEKIEGFFDICNARGLTGRQGVLIPQSNVKHLMLRQEVVDAVADGDFNVYGVESIEQGIELLTGVPTETVFEKTKARLEEFAAIRRRFGSQADAEKDDRKPQP
jgi:predicted ATP-dependent protease